MKKAADKLNQIYVSPEGQKNAQGTFEAPFGSLEEARDAIRKMKTDGSLPEGGIAVNLRGGEYSFLETSFILDGEQDSGSEGAEIIYRAYKDEEVKFTGNIVIEGHKFKPVTEESILERLPEDARNKVLVFDLTKELGITEFAPIQKSGFGWPATAVSPSILVDGVPQTLARYPKSGFTTFVNEDVVDTGFVPRFHSTHYDGTCESCKDETGASVKCLYGSEEGFIKQKGGVLDIRNQDYIDRIPLWQQENDIWTQGYWSWDWADDNCPVERVEAVDGAMRITMGNPSRYGVAAEGYGGRKFYIYNLLCEISQPGEWYLDRQHGKVYLYPQKDISDSLVEMTMLGKPMVIMKDVSYVHWQKISFAKANSHGIQMAGCHHTEIAGCKFHDLGQFAVYVGDPAKMDLYSTDHGADGGCDNVIRSCDIIRTGQGGIFLGGGNRYTLEHGNNIVTNCDISDYATIKRTYSPAVSMVGCGNSVIRNRIHQAPHMGIQYNGNDMLIAGNEIFDLLRETSDAGAVYTGRKWSWRGNKIFNNYFHDLGDGDRKAVYLDDQAADTETAYNLFLNIGCEVYCAGGGRDNSFHNNIQIGSKGAAFAYYAAGIDNNGNNRAHVTAPHGTCYAEWEYLKNQPEFDAEVWAERYPELTEMSYGMDSDGYCANAAIPAGVTVKNNIFVKAGTEDPFMLKPQVINSEIFRIKKNRYSKKEQMSALFHRKPEISG